MNNLITFTVDSFKKYIDITGYKVVSPVVEVPDKYFEFGLYGDKTEYYSIRGSDRKELEDLRDKLENYINKFLEESYHKL